MTSSDAETHVGYNLQDPEDREDRRKHLDLVSAVIARMASSSALFKGWSVTLAGAAFGVAIVRDSWYLFLLGLVGVAALALLDCVYLATEKRYRDLYAAIVDTNTVRPLSMKTDAVTSNPRNRSYLSWSVLFFYLPILAAGVVLFVVALATGPGDSQAPATGCPSRQHHQHEPQLLSDG